MYALKHHRLGTICKEITNKTGVKFTEYWKNGNDYSYRKYIFDVETLLPVLLYTELIKYAQ